MPAGILAGLLLGAAHLVLFHRGMTIAALAYRQPGIARGIVFLMSAMRLVLTATLGFAMVKSGIPPLGLGIGLLAALYVYRVGLMMLKTPQEGRV